MTRRLRIPIAVAALVCAFAAAVMFGRASNGPENAAAAVQNAAADPGALVPFLRFSGYGAVSVKPDQAQIDVGAQATADTSQKALADAGAKIQKVTDALKALGVADDDLRTDGTYTGQDDRKKWQAGITLHVIVRDVNRAGELLGAANAAGADSVSGPMFTVEKRDAAYASALAAAIADARAKAEAAAAQMGVAVTGVVSVDETGGAQPLMYATDMARAEGAASEDSSVPVQTGTQDVSSNVTVTFAYGPLAAG